MQKESQRQGHTAESLSLGGHDSRDLKKKVRWPLCKKVCRLFKSKLLLMLDTLTEYTFLLFSFLLDWFLAFNFIARFRQRRKVIKNFFSALFCKKSHQGVLCSYFVLVFPFRWRPLVSQEPVFKLEGRPWSTWQNKKELKRRGKT